MSEVARLGPEPVKEANDFSGTHVNLAARIGGAH